MIRLRTRQSFQLAMLIGLPLFILGSVFLIKPEASSFAKEKTKGSVTNPASMSGKELSEALSWQEIDALESAQAKAFGAALITKALSENRKPEHYASSAFPTASETLAMLARDRDVDDYLENAAEKGPAGHYYQAVVDLVPSMKPLRATYEKLFQGAYESLKENLRLKVPVQVYAEAELYRGGVTLPGLSSKPRERDYDYSHTFALDIFLKEVDLLPFSTLQKGPVLFSVADAIVVTTESSWNGGEELSTYRSGGITPKAGNGVILYSPGKQKYYLYFHLYDILVSPGQAIPKGYPLGHGGNTGTNARKKGHGEHLHLEIYDAVGARFLRNHEIADIVF